MHTNPINFIQDLAIIMLVAGMMTVLCQRFKQPVILGYLLAGIIIGPYTPPFTFIQDEDTIRTLAGLGIIFIMFSLGLEFNLRKLKKLGMAVAIIALVEIVLMTALGYAVGRAFAWSFIDSIFLGAMLAVSSTTIIIKALEELGMKHENFAQIIFGVLIVEDIFAIVIIALLNSVALTGTLHAQSVMLTLGELLSFLVVSLVFGLLTIPRFLSYISRFKSKEILLIAVLGMCFGFCLIAMKLNYSVALGAFVIGAIMAESSQLPVIESLVASLRDMFSAIFFVSIGLLFNPEILLTHLWPTVVITVVVVVGKVLTCGFGAIVTGKDGKTSMRVGMGMAQIGEFSFIIAGLGVVLNVSSPFLYPIAIVVSVITTLLTPYLIRYSDPISHQLDTMVPHKARLMFEQYRMWLHPIKHNKYQEDVKKILRRCVFQLMINVFIILAIFFAASFLETTIVGDTLEKYSNQTTDEAILCTISLLLALPCLVAAYQIMRVITMILMKYNNEKLLPGFLRLLYRFSKELPPSMALILIFTFIGLINKNIVPPIEVLTSIILVVAILAFAFHSKITKLHNYLQVRLLETMRTDE